jgi:protein-tyrosine-phosphatase
MDKRKRSIAADGQRRANLDNVAQTIGLRRSREQSAGTACGNSMIHFCGDAQEVSDSFVLALDAMGCQRGHADDGHRTNFGERLDSCERPASKTQNVGEVMALRLCQFTLHALLVAAAALLAEGRPYAAVAQDVSSGIKTVVFVCLHGSVNSQMAAAYFNRTAKERGVSYVAISRGIDVHRSIPVRILDGLALDGLAPANSPQELTMADANAADKIFAFDAIRDEQKGDASVTNWSGVPLGINDYEAARDEIVQRIDELIPTLTAN